MEVHYDTAVSALAGSSVAVAMAKIYMQKCLSDLSKALEQIANIQNDLAAMTVKLQQADNGAQLLHDHDRKIAALEAVTYNGGRTRNNESSSQRAASRPENT